MPHRRILPLVVLLALAAVPYASAQPAGKDPPKEATKEATKEGTKPPGAGSTVEKAPEPDPEFVACAERLAPVAAFSALPAVTEPAECALTGLVRLEAVLMADRSRIALEPPATLRCAMAEAVAQFVRMEVAPAVAELGSPLRSIQVADSFSCRSRNRQPGARLSEHGRANALDIGGLRLADRRVVSLTSQAVAEDFRGRVRDASCRWFTTVLGPGSDAFHNDHIHLDRAERSRGFRLCQWELKPPPPPPPTQIAAASAPPVLVILPMPLPKPLALRPKPRSKAEEARARRE